MDPASISPDLAAAPTLNKWWGRANSFTTGPGAKPGRGYLLLTRAAAARLTFTADQTLTFSGEDPDHVVTLAKITALSSECISPGSITDGTATYLVRVADRRHLDAMVPLDKGYNIAKADGSAYMVQTLEDGAVTPWTWQQIVQDIANVMSYGVLTLPFTPSGTPENLFYFGVPSALSALCDVLSRCGCDLAYDPILDEFSVVRLGTAADTYLTAIPAQREWDGYSAEYARGYYPETLRVRFLRHPYDNTSGFSPFWFEDVALAATAGVEPGTVVQIDDDLTALATSGTPTNAAALATRAAERAADWLRKRVYYDRPVLRAWRDFVPTAAGLGAFAVNRVIFDDRGGVMQTWAEQEADGALENWRPLSNLPPWYPLPVSAPGSGSGPGDECASPVTAVTFTCSPVSGRTATVQKLGVGVEDGIPVVKSCGTEVTPLGPCSPVTPPGTPMSVVNLICLVPAALTSTAADYAARYADDLIHVTAAAKTVTLPDPADAPNGPGGDIIPIKNASAGNLTIATAAGLIDGAATKTLTTMQAVKVYTDGADWFSIY